MRKINNILESCEADIDLIDKKIKLMCYLGDAEKAKHYLESIEQIIKKIRESSYYLNLGFIFENLNKRKEAKDIY